MTVLRGGRVVDGTGSPARDADVVIEGGTIAAVVEPGKGRDGDVVDVDGLVVAPGFIDCHTHYDAQILWDPELTPSSWHGITTVVMGNCGFGVAPTRPEHRETIALTLENVEGMTLDALVEGIPWTFETFPEYLDAIERLPIRLNVAVMIGHTPLRLFVMGEDAVERPASADEIARMRHLVGEALDAGAVGFATSRSIAHAGAWGKPVPSRLAALDEVWEISEALHERQRGTFAITYGTDFHVAEFSELSKRTGRPVTWTALSANGLTPGALEILERQAAGGGEVYPQVACRPIVAQITLADPFPLARFGPMNEVFAVSREQRASVYRDPAWRERARATMNDVRWHHISVEETSVHHDLKGRPLTEIAAERGVHPVDVWCDLGLAENLQTRFRYIQSNFNGPELAELLRDDRVLLGLSDAGAHASQICDAVFSTYLLQHWVREEQVLSLEKAIWRLTGHPAHVYRLRGRGRIAPGYAADLTVFDPDSIAVEEPERVWDLPAGADRLVAGSRGIHHVWINGVHVVADEKPLDAHPGVLLRDSGA